MAKARFTAKLYKAANGYVCIDLPLEVIEQLKLEKRTPVKGRMNGLAVRTSALATEAGGFRMTVNKPTLAATNAGAGDTVQVELEVEHGPRRVEVPADLQKGLNKSKVAKAEFARRAYSWQKEHVDYVEDARRSETRAKRIGQVVDFLIAEVIKAGKGN